MTIVAGVEGRGRVEGCLARLLLPEALKPVGSLERELGRRSRSSSSVAARQDRLDRAESLDFPPETRAVPEGDWRVSPAPHALTRQIRQAVA